MFNLMRKSIFVNNDEIIKKEKRRKRK